MKIKSISLFIVLFVTTNLFSQTVSDTTDSNLNDYKWQIEAAIGDSKGLTPYKEGYYSSDSFTKFGSLKYNSINFGITYNNSKLINYKLNLGFDRFTNKNSESLPFETVQFRTMFQGVMNLNNWVKFQPDNSRLKLLLHGGLSLSFFQNVDSINNNRKTSNNDLNGGVVYGITPMYRIANKVHLFLDINSIYNFRQHRAWDGSMAPENKNLTGKMTNLSFGVNVAFGKRIPNKTN